MTASSGQAEPRPGPTADGAGTCNEIGLCAFCGEPITAKWAGKAGRPRTTCSTACRVARCRQLAKRRKQA